MPQQNKRRENKLLIMARSERQAQFLQNSLYSVLQDEIMIDSYIHNRDAAERLAAVIAWQPALIITLDAEAYQLASQIFRVEKIVPATLEVSEPQSLERLLQLPKDKRVLAVHKTESSAKETIRSLVNLGVDHLEYLPYWQDCGLDTTGIDTAVSTVSLEYAPPQISHKIDLGFRRLSISAFVEILKQFQLSMAYADQYAIQERKTLISPSKQLGTELQDSYSTLHALMDDLHEALVTLDQDYRVQELNDAAQQMLDLRREEVVGRPVAEVLPAHFAAALSAGELLPKQETPLTVNRRALTAAFYPLPQNGPLLGTIKFRPPELERAQAQAAGGISPRQRNHTKYSFADIIATNEVMSRLIDHAKTLAQTNLPILISGESGTGKEMFAQSIHNHSARALRPFVAVNFAALPENLIESELFGYEEGAFTGARKSGKQGLFELAHTGTIFLDEIGDASIAAQTRLLRILEEKELRRVGGTQILPVDIRVIAATNKDLQKGIAEGWFREDLYYRLRGFPLALPTLRAQQGSLMQIIARLLAGMGETRRFSPETTTCILTYNWLGNMRELKNMLEYVTQTARGELVELNDLPIYLLEQHYCRQSALRELDHNLLADLSLHCDLQHVRIILETIARNQQQGKITGRSQLLQAFGSQSVPISENRVRTLPRQLNSFGLIEIGTTKQGSTISAKGADILQTLRA